jgi:hypothetical protein
MELLVGLRPAKKNRRIAGLTLFIFIQFCFFLTSPPVKSIHVIDAEMREYDPIIKTLCERESGPKQICA